MERRYEELDNKTRNKLTKLNSINQEDRDEKKEFENKIEEIIEERENWRDLLYQEKQKHKETVDKCKVTRRVSA